MKNINRCPVSKGGLGPHDYVAGGGYHFCRYCGDTIKGPSDCNQPNQPIVINVPPIVDLNDITCKGVGNG